MDNSAFDESALDEVEVPRKVMDQKEFDHLYGAMSLNEPTLGDRIWKIVVPSKDSLTLRGLWKRFLSFFPFISIMGNYKLSYFLKDVIAGITVGIMNIPQGMAYGLLAGLDPVYGLYVTLVLPMVYALFTKSHHVAMGTFAIISLIVNGVIHRVQEEYLSTELTANLTETPKNWWCGVINDNDATALDNSQLVEIVVSLTLLVGIIQVILGLLHFGFLSSYLSSSLVSALTTGAAIHVCLSQLSHATGVENLPVTGIPLGIIKYIGCYVRQFHTINWATLIFTIVCSIFIYVFKVYIDPRTKRKIKFPLPIDLSVVIISTLVVWGFNLHNKYDINIVGKIPVGLPTLMVPNIRWWPYFLPDAITLAFVSYSLNVSLGKLYGKKFGYQIDQNQEWYAIGLAHIFGSFFQCHPGGASMSRSQVQSTSGGKTQVVNIVSSLMILVVLVALSQLFYNLPKSALAAIILVAIRKMVFQVHELPGLYRKSKIDACIWVVTCLTVLLVNVSIGLAVGVAFSLLTVIFRQQWPSSVELAELSENNGIGSGIFKTKHAYNNAKSIPGVIIVRMDAPLSFVNVDTFTELIYKTTGIVPLRELRKRINRERRGLKNGSIANGIDCESKGGELLQFLIIDCGSIPYIDIMGIQILQDIYQEYKNIGVDVIFADCKLAVRLMQSRCAFHEIVPESCQFPNVAAAVESIKLRTITKHF